MDLPVKAKTYQVKLGERESFKIDERAAHMQMRPSQLIREIVEDWLAKR